MFGGLRTKLKYPNRFYRPDTPVGAAIYYHFAKFITERRPPPLPAQVSIPKNKGYIVSSIQGIETLSAHVEGIDWKYNNPYEKPFLRIRDVPFDKIKHLADQILPTVSAYIGSLPVLAVAQVWKSPNTEDIGGSQRFHMDGEDRRQVKCFLPLKTIDHDSGPFCLLPADISSRVFKALRRDGHIKRRNTKISDEIMTRYFDPSELVEITGEPGTVAMVDTCRCYHFGSRLASKSRLLFHLHFFSAYSMEMPLWGRMFDDPVYGAAHLMFPVRRRAERSRRLHQKLL